MIFERQRQYPVIERLVDVPGAEVPANESVGRLPGVIPGGNGDSQKSVEMPSAQPPAQESAGPQPIAVYGKNVDPQRSDRIFFIIHRHQDGEPTIYRCEGTRETQVFLEMLIGDGVDQEDLDVFRGSKVGYRLSFRPVVDIESA